VFAAGAALLLIAAAAAIYVLDPFGLLRPARGTPNLYGVPAYQIPGLARHYPYNAVVIGTSTSNNFRPEDVSARLGGQAINFSLAGSSLEEQRAALDVALATGKVRRVFWGLDPFAFLPREGRSFPYYLYREPGWRMAPYFVNLGALDHALVTLVTPDDRRTSLAQWNADRSWANWYVYGQAQVLTAWTHRRAIGPAPLLDDPARATRLVDDAIVDTIRTHPSVRFDLVLLPYSVLYYKMLLVDRPRELDLFCALDAEIVARAGALPNAAVHNFRDTDDLFLDLSNFHDLIHFSGEVSVRILGDVAAGRHRVTPASFQGVCGRIRTAAAAFEVPGG
jgi:hypothetical protein